MKIVGDVLGWGLFLGIGIGGMAASVLIAIQGYRSVLDRPTSRPAAVIASVLLGMVSEMGLWIVLGPYFFFRHRNDRLAPG